MRILLENEDLIFRIAYEGNLKELIKLIHEDPSLAFKKASNGNGLIFFVVEAGHLKLLQWLVQFAGVSIDERNRAGSNALMHAARHGRSDIVQWLMKQGSDVNETDNYGNTVLVYAAVNAHLGLVQWLIQHGKAKVKKNNSGNTLLFWAVHSGCLDLVQWLVTQGYADINEKNNRGDTVLITAIQKGYLNTVQFLIEKGAKNEVNKQGMTPLLTAVSNAYVNIVHYILEHFDLSYVEIRTAFACLLKLNPHSSMRPLLKKELDKSNKIIESLELPAEFFCPISCELMVDPVIAPDTYTYEREAIEQALLTNPISPMTRAPINKEQLIVNRSLKELIIKTMDYVDAIRKGQNKSLAMSSIKVPIPYV